MDKIETKLTILVPIYNEELVIERFLSQLIPVVQKLDSIQKCHLVFINNGSTDSSLELLKKLNDSSSNYGILSLARNFGYETALIAGLTHTDSDYYALCDGDGEDPVEMLLRFQQSILVGNQIAIGIRKNRVESLITKTFRNLSYGILSRLGDDPFRKNAGNFSMFSRVVRNAILTENNSYPFLRSTLSRTGYKLEEFPHNRNPRIDGKSKYRKISLLKFAIAGFMTSTTWPLRFVAYMGGINSMLAVPYFLFNAKNSNKYFSQNILLLVSLETLTFLGVVSLYLARIYKNSLGRPLYYVDWSSTFEFGKFKFVKNHE
jgi:dolichol-phosphate mannosyltransferase